MYPTEKRAMNERFHKKKREKGRTVILNRFRTGQLLGTIIFHCNMVNIYRSKFVGCETIYIEIVGKSCGGRRVPS